MIVLLYILFILAALVLLIVVLIQDDKGEGLGGLFGGGSATPFGSRSGNVLTRFTGIVAAVFLITSIIVGLANRSKELSEITEQTSEQTTRQKFFEPAVRETAAPETGGSMMEGSSPAPAPSALPESN